MDINYLLSREQVERVRAAAADNDNVRAAHAGLADGYRALVDGHRRDRVAAAGRGEPAPEAGR